MGCLLIDYNGLSQEELDCVRTVVSENPNMELYPVITEGEEKTNSDLLRLKCFPFYHFETNLSFWKECFEKRRSVLWQKLFLFDYSWKMKANVLWPYHYEKSHLLQVQREYHQIFEYIDNEIIMNSKWIDTFQKYYFLSLGDKNEIRVVSDREQLMITCNDEVYYTAKKLEIVLTKYRPQGKYLEIVAFIKSPIFSFTKAPQLYVQENDSSEKKEVELRPSSWNFYKTKEEICRFYQFSYRISIDLVNKFHFYVRLNGVEYDTYYYFMPDVVFNTRLNRYCYYQNGYVFRFERNTFYVQKKPKEDKVNYYNQFQNKFQSELPETAAFRTRIYEARNKKKDQIWLYYDCKGVKRDNGYYQFVYDLEKKDKVKRYYILNDDLDMRRDLFNEKQWECVVPFGSQKHKLLYCLADFVITAFIEKNNYLPFTDEEYQNVQDVATIPQIIYLQHGVFHAHIPWKYSVDRMQVDKMVVTAKFEKKNMLALYGFKKHQLIESCMPRNDLFDLDEKPKRKILYAPSWRKYLVDMVGHQWVTREDLFLNSRFYKEINAFLTDRRLLRFLKWHHYRLELKMHPILYRYAHLFNLDGKYIKLAEETVREEEYSIFITDFSNYVYDFAYLRRKVIYFFPDYEEFLSGMSDYRESERPFEGGIGDFASDSRELYSLLKKAVRHSGKPNKQQYKEMDNMFLHRDYRARKRIYETLSKPGGS